MLSPSALQGRGCQYRENSLWGDAVHPQINIEAVRTGNSSPPPLSVQKILTSTFLGH